MTEIIRFLVKRHLRWNQNANMVISMQVTLKADTEMSTPARSNAQRGHIDSGES